MIEATTNSAPSRPSEERPGQEFPQLSCDLCRERKVKCDKLDPCSNCATAGVACSTIYRNRLPRGRHANRSGVGSAPSSGANHTHPRRSRAVAAAQTTNRELRQRIQRLETLFQGNPGTESAVGPRHGPTDHVGHVCQVIQSQ